MANSLKDLGRLREAEASYKQAIALKPDFVEAHSNLGNTLQDMGKIEESVSIKQQAFNMRTGISPIGDESLSPATTVVFILN